MMEIYDGKLKNQDGIFSYFNLFTKIMFKVY